MFDDWSPGEIEAWMPSKAEIRDRKINKVLSMNVQELIDELMLISDKTRQCTDVNGDAINTVDPYNKEGQAVGPVYVIFDEENLYNYR